MKKIENNPSTATYNGEIIPSEKNIQSTYEGNLFPIFLFTFTILFLLIIIIKLQMKQEA